MNLLDDTQIQVQDRFSPEQSFAMLNAEAREACTLLPREFFSLILTSPSYNIGKQYEQPTTLAQYLDTQTQIIKQIVPLLTPNGSLCWQVGNYVENGEVFPLAVGVDRDAEYCRIAKERLASLHNGPLKVRPLGKPVHKPTRREKIA